MRLALKLATGAGKTTVMAMIIAWQTINAVRQSGSSRYTSGFLVVTPGLTIRDRLQVLQPNDRRHPRLFRFVPATGSLQTGVAYRGPPRGYFFDWNSKA
jgi:hypothetical protein